MWEETGKCTTKAAGVGVLARRERIVEITSGGCYSQQGLTATCKDLILSKTKYKEGLGSSHEFIVVMKAE